MENKTIRNIAIALAVVAIIFILIKLFFGAIGMLVIKAGVAFIGMLVLYFYFTGKVDDSNDN